MDCARSGRICSRSSSDRVVSSPLPLACSLVGIQAAERAGEKGGPLAEHNGLAAAQVCAETKSSHDQDRVPQHVIGGDESLDCHDVVVLSGSCAAPEAITCHCRANADRASGTRIDALEPEIAGLQRPGLM